MRRCMSARQQVRLGRGDISIENILGTGRQESPEMWKIRSQFFFKKVEDYEPIIAMVKDTIHHTDLEEFKLKDTELATELV